MADKDVCKCEGCRGCESGGESGGESGVEKDELGVF